MAASDTSRRLFRRSIEVLVGAAVLLPTLLVAYLEGRRLVPDVPFAIALIVGLLWTFAVGLLTVVAILTALAVGEAVCNSLERRGIRLRPRQ